MSVIARFYVSEVSRKAYDRGAVVVGLQAVSRGPENKEWAAATPHANLTMTIKNGPAAEFFANRLGQDIAVRFDAHDDEAAYLSPHGS
jgi:hypothetical protein